MQYKTLALALFGAAAAQQVGKETVRLPCIMSASNF